MEQVKQVFKKKENSEHFNWGVIGEEDKEEEGGEGKKGMMKTTICFFKSFAYIHHDILIFSSELRPTF